MDASMTDSSNAHNVSVIDPEGHSQTTQPNSQPSQPLESDLDAWGLLIPCNPGLELVRLLKTQRKIKIGRDRTNHVPLRWVCASAFHAVINWNGKTGSDSEVTITDLSLNGTYIKGEKIGKGLARVLTDGNELSFGFVSRPKREREPEYKYIYRDLVTEDRELYKKYDLSIQLGQGSFARVYKALQKGTSKWVAVKVINQTIRHNVTAAIAEAQLLREIRIMLTLRHPNICELHEFFRNPNTSIDLVLEFVGGGDLLSFITHPKHNDGLTDWMCCHLTFQICKALVYIHSKGITHRDLKPENILLTDEDPPIVKIADFGLAKLVDEATALRTMCGTPTYIAPEIVMRDNNNVPYTNVVDSWSVGVILFVMFTKTTPLPKVPTSQLKELIMKAQIDWDSLDSLKSHIASTPGKDLVRRLLEFEPVTRMTLDDALYHPWLFGHKHVYEITYPGEQEAITRTASLESGGSNPAPGARARAMTQDPYDDGPPPTRAVTEDPYADDAPQAPPRNPLRTPARLETVAEIGLSGGACTTLPIPGFGGAAVVAGAQLLVQQPAVNAVSLDSSDFLYGPAPAVVPVVLPTLAEVREVEGGAQKRPYAEMHTAGSSPLSSIESPPPARKKGKTAAAAGAEPKAAIAAGPSPRKAKGKKKKEDSDTDTATRHSSRPARRAKR